MIEFVIHGRGGRGGVTLAKLIAGAYFSRGKHAQAFGVYGAERTGAPVQAYVRVDDEEITIHGAITAPDHVIVIDPSLVAPELVRGMSDDGWLVINAPQAPEALADTFPGRNVAVVDADAIAVANRLGTKSLPIVNTTLLGAVARVLGLELDAVEGALTESGFGGANIEAARAAFGQVATVLEPGSPLRPAPLTAEPMMGILDEAVGTAPTTRTGSWASRLPHARRLAALCGDSCPAGNDVRGFVQAAAAGDYDEALGIVLAASPFPGVCGRVCPAPCTTACNRAALDAAVDVRGIERAVAERGAWPAPVAPFRDERVAVVGAGPAGLAAAYHLVRRGYCVTLLEATDSLGGVLRTGIPEYRLPRDVLDREIDFILSHGIEVKTWAYVDQQVLAELTDEYAAVFVATGQQVWNRLELEGPRASRVDLGLEFLGAARRGTVPDLDGQSVVVAGGGNTAFDAARTALRLGAADVRVAYRRTRTEMPAIDEEIDEALEEGVVIDELTAPVRLRANGKGATLVCRRFRLGEPDASGRPRPEPILGDDGLVELRCDKLLFAVGQKSDRSLLLDDGPTMEAPIQVGTSVTPVFLGGDFATGEGTVAAAIGSGRRAAEAIDAALSPASITTPPSAAAQEDADAVADDQPAGPEVMHLHAFPHSARQPSALLDASVRRTNFAEVRQGFVDLPDDDAAAAEARRCLSCGACNACDICIAFCPEGVLRRVDDQTLEFDYEYCKGCGLCAAECPRGAVVTAAV